MIVLLVVVHVLGMTCTGFLIGLCAEKYDRDGVFWACWWWPATLPSYLAYGAFRLGVYVHERRLARVRAAQDADRLLKAEGVL